MYLDNKFHQRQIFQTLLQADHRIGSCCNCSLIEECYKKEARENLLYR